MLIVKDPVLLLKIYFLSCLFLFISYFTNAYHLAQIFTQKMFRPFFSFKEANFDRLSFYLNFVLSHWPFYLKDKFCLVKSLILYCFLKPKKENAHWIMGVTRDEHGRWNGHAWVEANGLPFLEDKSIAQFEKIRVRE